MLSVHWSLWTSSLDGLRTHEVVAVNRLVLAIAVVVVISLGVNSSYLIWLENYSMTCSWWFKWVGSSSTFTLHAESNLRFLNSPYIAATVVRLNQGWLRLHWLMNWLELRLKSKSWWASILNISWCVRLVPIPWFQTYLNWLQRILYSSYTAPLKTTYTSSRMRNNAWILGGHLGICANTSDRDVLLVIVTLILRHLL